MSHTTTPTILEIGTPIARPDLFHDRPELTTVDIIGDVHGCFDELLSLLAKLGHPDPERNDKGGYPAGMPPLLFVGDLIDRGDRIIDTLDYVMTLCERGHAYAVIGNHDDRFLRWLMGSDVPIKHGLDRTIAEFQSLPREAQRAMKARLITFFHEMPNALRFDNAKAVVVHAAYRPGMKIEQETRKIRSYAMYGPTTGETTPSGFPVRIDWSRSYRGPEFVVFGHQVYVEPYLTPNAAGIDTGCVFGGALTALRWPSRELVSVKSREARAAYGGPIDDPNKGIAGEK